MPNMVICMGVMSSSPAIRLAEVPDEVRTLITHGLFYGASRVLTSVATYHPGLDFATIYSGYADGWSMEDSQSLGESLLPHIRLVAEQVSAQWVMDAHHVDMARSVRQEDIAQSADGVEPGSEVDVAPPLAEPNVAQSEDKQPLPSPIKPVVDATEEP